MNENPHEMAARLQKARREAGFATPTDAAIAMDVRPPTYLGHENGSRGFRASASRYADRFKVNLEWLITGRGPMKRSGLASAPPTEHPVPQHGTTLTTTDINFDAMPRDVPILGGGSCGDDGMFELNGQIHDHAKRPPRLIGVTGAYAIWVMGLSMFPWRKNGELVYVHPFQPVNVGNYVVVQLKPDKPGGNVPVYIKELVRRTQKELRLRQYNPAEEITIPMSKVSSIHHIMDWQELLGI